MSSTAQLWLYHLEQWATQLVQSQLQHLSPVSLLAVGLAGLLTSLSPCTLSMLPVTIGYIGGYTPNPDEGAGKVRRHIWAQSLGFAAGVAFTLTLLGLGAALLGRVYGQTGSFWPTVVGGVAILMGLNLLEVIPLRFPAWFNRLEIPGEWPRLGRAVLLGSTFGLVASPCSTPVLVALLAWVSTTGQPWVGAGCCWPMPWGWSCRCSWQGCLPARSSNCWPCGAGRAGSPMPVAWCWWALAP